MLKEKYFVLLLVGEGKELIIDSFYHDGKFWVPDNCEYVELTKFHSYFIIDKKGIKTEQNIKEFYQNRIIKNPVYKYNSQLILIHIYAKQINDILE